MLSSPQGAAQGNEPAKARPAQLQCQSDQNASGKPQTQPSPPNDALPSPNKKKLKIRRERRALKIKKKTKAQSVDAEMESTSIDIKSAISALAQQMEQVQLQCVQVDANNRIVPPQLNSEQERVLGNNFVSLLEYRSVKHPAAIFQCAVCKKFCKSYSMVLNHVNDGMHKTKLQRVRDDMTLRCLPTPTKEQIAHITKMINKIHITRSLPNKAVKERKAVEEKLNTLAKKLQPDCGVRIYGSTVTGLALKTSDLNLELTMSDESMASKMFCLLADEIEKDEDTYRHVQRNFTDSEPTVRFFVKEHNFQCGIIMQNKHSYQLTKLIADYVGIDQRVKPLGVMLRTLAMDVGLDKPDLGFWPPHAFALLMIYFLQQLKDPVLPVLHELVDSLEYNPEVYFDVKQLAQKWHTTNTMSVGELWLKFLRFYTVEFPIEDYVVCIRQKAPLTRASKNWNGRKIAIEDPFIPKANVSRSLEVFTCFEFAMNCLRKAYKYFGVLQLPQSPILTWIYDSSKFKCTFEPLIATRKVIDRYPNWIPFFSTKPIQTGQNANSLCPEMPVAKEDVGFLFEILNPKYLHYKYEPAKFIGKEGLPIRCATCGNMGHSASKCKVEKLLPIPENLPPMEDYYLDAIMKLCTEIEERWSMQPEEVEKRIQIVTDLEEFVREKKPEAVLELFGSSCNGFGLQKSDIDICMTYKDNETGEGVEFVKAIEELTHMLKSYSKTKSILAITTAKVPITKFYLPESDLEGDISMYNVLALRNTQLLNTYAAIDPRVKTLGCVVKRFAKACDICDASRGSLSSYAYILMLIFFLQRSDPPVLPVLQELCKPLEPKYMVDGFDTYFFSDLDKLPSVWEHYGKNTASVSELWLEFLKFYSKFHFNLHVISIRQLKILLCFEKRWTNKVMAIEDPFELTHNLGARLSRKMLVYIINTFRTAYHLFGTPRISCLEHTGRLENYFLDPHQLTSGDPPNDRGCRLCKKTDHMIKQCPLRKQNRSKNMQQRRGNGQIIDRRPGIHNEPTNAGNMVPQAGKRPILHPRFSYQQPVMPSQASYKQLLFMNSEMTRNAQNLRYNKVPSAFAVRNTNSRQHTSSALGTQLSNPKFNININQATVGSSVQRVDFGFSAERDSTLSHRTRDLALSVPQNSTIHPFRFQPNNGVSLPGPSSASQNPVFNFSAEKVPGPSPGLFNGVVSPLKHAVFEGPPPPSSFCFYGPPQTPPVIDVTVNYTQRK